MSSSRTRSSTLCMVLPTKPNSTTRAASLIKRASDVPPLVDNSGCLPVTECTAALRLSTKLFGAEKKLKTELLDLPNTILIPHMGSATVEGRIEMGEKVIVNIKTFIDGHNPPNRII